MIALLLCASACGSDQRAEDPLIIIEPDAGIGVDVPHTEPDANDSGDTNHPVTPGEHDGIVVLLDGYETTLTGGVSSPIEVTVPSDAVALTITVEGQEAETYALASWKGPDGFEYVSSGWYTREPMLCFTRCTNRIAPAEGAFAAIAPNNPESLFEPGKHTFSAYGFATSGFNTVPSTATVRVTVQAKVHPTLPESGVLDLNLHFTGAGGWTAEIARASSEFNTILEKVEAIYAQAGITLGTLTWNDVDARFRVIESHQGANSDLGNMLKSSASAPQNAVNIFFVEEIKGPMGVILGIAGGIPGPPLAQGTVKSGVAVTTSGPQGSPPLENVIAHEVGHFLGLFHTTEHFSLPGYMPEHDPLPDTPENDTTYLMHAGSGGSTLSPWQGRVMRQNPWVRHSEND